MKTATNSTSSLPFLITAIGLMMSLSITVEYSKEEGHLSYSFASVMVIVELTKFCASIIFFIREVGLSDAMTQAQSLTLMDVLRFAPPAIIYSVNNQLIFVLLTVVDPTSFQVLNNTKIIATALLFRAVFGRAISQIQWSAIVLLTVGVTLSQIKQECADPLSGLSGGSDPDQPAGLSFGGLFLGLLQAVLSGFAGVYTEAAMKGEKREKSSLHLQNARLYFFGLSANLISFFLTGQNQGADGATGFFHNWTPAVWVVVLFHSANGISVSMIMKYLSNMVKLFASAAALVLTGVLQFPMFGKVPSLNLIFGIVIVVNSTFLYNVGKVKEGEVGKV